MIDFVVNGIEEYTGITIISERSNEIKQFLIEKVDRGVTVYHGGVAMENGGKKLRIMTLSLP